MRLTEETLNTLCDAIVKEHAVRFACAFAGISETSYVRWRLRGLDILEERDEGKEPEIADEESYLNSTFRRKRHTLDLVSSVGIQTRLNL